MPIAKEFEGSLLTTTEVARLLRVKPNTLRQWRHMGTGPSFVRAGPKLVLYRHSAIEEYLRTREVKAK